MARLILVTGATGNQGGSVVDALLKAGKADQYTILAVTRDINSSGAKKLASKGKNIKLVAGNLDQVPELFDEAGRVAGTEDPIWGVYSVQVSHGKGVSVEGEIKQGKAMVDESVKRRVSHFVYGSVDRGGDEASWDKETPIEHFKTKYHIERHLRDAAGQMGWTILRPTAFFDNLAPGMPARVFLTAMRDSLHGKPNQWIAVSDIGWFAAEAFDKPEHYNHRALGLAGDQLTYDEQAAIFAKRVVGPPTPTFSILGSVLKWAIGDLGVMLTWFGTDGYKVDIAALRKIKPDLMDFDAWLTKDGKFPLQQPSAVSIQPHFSLHVCLCISSGTSMATSVQIPARRDPYSDSPERSDLSHRIPKLVPRRGSRQTELPAKPRPATPHLIASPDLTGNVFTEPVRRILGTHDHETFLKSRTCDLVTAFVFALSESVEDTSVSSVRARDQDPIVTAVLGILDEAELEVRGHPAADNQGSRFGNPIFRDFLDAISARQASWHASLLVPSSAVQEVSTYMQHCFGNRTRIDYGSGHELNFALWLLCLNRLSLLPPPTFPALTLLVFPRYLRLMRLIQMTYYLEPAGSHGVWGLDDYQFLPFLFGASQLLHHPHIRPMSIHQDIVLEQCAKDYLYLDQVSFVNSVKNVEGLRWHSPMLDDISSAKNWTKVEAGMRRMFLAEVLGKLPVMQHFLFGSLIPAEDDMAVEEAGAVGGLDADGMKHVHAVTGWSDCCGIPVPSSVGAMQEAKKRGTDQGLRRLPFD